MLEVDRLVERALDGDHESLVKAFRLIYREIERGSASLIESPSLRKIYDEVEEGIRASARSQLRRHGRLAGPGADPRAQLAAITQDATAAWFMADPRSRPPWSPNNGASLVQFVESQAQRYVKDAVERIIRRGT